MVRNTILSTVGALIVAAFTYYFFTPHPNDPAGHLKIEYQDFRLAREVFVDAIAIAIPGNDTAFKDGAKRFQDRFDFYPEYTAGKYVVSNEGPETIDEVTAHLGSYFLGYIDQGDGWVRLTEKQPFETFKILPNKKVEILLLMKSRFALYASEETFLVKGRKIEIKEINPVYEDPFVPTFREHPFLTFMFCAMGIVGLLAVLCAAALAIFSRNDPAAQAKSAPSESLANSLALINWLKIENPEKFDQVVKQAERTHARWSKQNTRAASSEGS